MERLGISYSSVESDEDDWIGIYAESFLSYNWIFVSDADESLPWCRSSDSGEEKIFK